MAKTTKKHSIHREAYKVPPSLNTILVVDYLRPISEWILCYRSIRSSLGPRRLLLRMGRSLCFPIDAFWSRRLGLNVLGIYSSTYSVSIISSQVSFRSSWSTHVQDSPKNHHALHSHLSWGLPTLNHKTCHLKGFPRIYWLNWSHRSCWALVRYRHASPSIYHPRHKQWVEHQIVPWKHHTLANQILISPLP